MKQPEIKNRKGFGIQRDRQIVNFVLKHRYVTEQQIADLFFVSVAPEWRLRKANERLKILVKRGYFKQFLWLDGQRVYSPKPEKSSHKINHALTVTEVITALKSKLANWENLDYEVESEEGNVIPDLKVNYQNTFKNFGVECYCEIQLDSHEPIDAKVNKYVSVLLENKCAVLVIVYKHKRTADALLEMRLPGDLKKRIWAIPLDKVKKEGLNWGALRGVS